MEKIRMYSTPSAQQIERGPRWQDEERMCLEKELTKVEETAKEEAAKDVTDK